MTSAIPTGGALDSSTDQTGSATPGGGTVAAGTWLPPFKIGQGLTGVFTDARGLIAGEMATATGQAASSSTSGSNSSSTPGNDAPGGAASTAPSGGAASAIPSGGAAPKASSQAQRQKNLNDAYSQYGTGPNPDTTP